jgi:2-hydroxycyclohexanecarboxyl-CoA dehydrogenase
MTAARVAVVTGGASGIGEGIAHKLAVAGHSIAVLDRDAAGAEQVVGALRAEGASAVAVEVDVADWEATAAAFDRVRAELGPVAILVTSAGIEAFDSVREMSPATWERVIAVNLTGTFTCVRAAVGDMVEAGWGRIVTISSSAAQSGSPMMSHYAASKGGVISLTKALAREFAGNRITVNTIPPSLVDTPMARQAEARGMVRLDRMASMVPLGRAGTVDDVAEACAFLCSEAAGYITGQVIGVNGGMYI